MAETRFVPSLASAWTTDASLEFLRDFTVSFAPETAFWILLAVWLVAEARDDSDEQSLIEPAEERLDLVVFLVGWGGGILGCPIIPLDVDLFAILELESFFFFIWFREDLWEALDEAALAQLSSEEQEDVNSFFEAAEERKVDLTTEGFGNVGLREMGILGTEGSLPAYTSKSSNMHETDTSNTTL